LSLKSKERFMGIGRAIKPGWALALVLTFIGVTASDAQEVQKKLTAEEAFEEMFDDVQLGAVFIFFSLNKPELQAKTWLGMGLHLDTVWPDTQKTGRPDGALGSRWALEDAGGMTVVDVQVPQLLFGKRDYATLTFFDKTPSPTAPGILAHLLTKAEMTSVETANTIRLTFPTELVAPQSQCGFFKTLTLRLTDGALLIHKLVATCPTIVKGGQP
jgi:hypothetical protein